MYGVCDTDKTLSVGGGRKAMGNGGPALGAKVRMLDHAPRRPVGGLNNRAVACCTMREEWKQSQDGAPTLKQWPETGQERVLKPVELAFLAATLTKLAKSGPEVAQQIEHATYTCREMTGYGAFLELDVPDHLRSLAEIDRDQGGAVLAWRDSSRMLVSIAWFDKGLLVALEMYPVYDEAWSPQECLAILSAPLEEVDITPQGW